MAGGEYKQFPITQVHKERVIIKVPVPDRYVEELVRQAVLERLRNE